MSGDSQANPRRAVTIGVRVLGGPGEEGQGSIEAVRRPLIKKLGLGAGSMIGCTVLAMGGVFVPVLHFFLVPGLLITGFGIALRIFLEKYRVITTDVRCPVCSADLSLPERLFRTTCYIECCGCSRRLFVELRA